MDSFKFNCPHCGRHIEAEANMVGLVFDCPVCGRPFKVPEAGDGHHEAAQCRTPNRIAINPSGETKAAHPARPVVITVIRKRDGSVARYKKRVAMGVGFVAVLLTICVLVAVIFNMVKGCLGIETQYNVGMIYYNGDDGVVDYTEAAKWFHKAAKQGHARAQYMLGFCYCDGKGVPENMAKATEWFRKAAEQGLAEAQILLGFCYDRGEGVQEDYVKAAEWYRKAAEQGRADAQILLGFCYDRGEGVQEDYAKAAEWYRKAAEQGHAYAQYKLGVCYYKGKGVPRDKKKAIWWLEKAKAQGNQAAIDLLAKIGLFEC